MISQRAGERESLSSFMDGEMDPDGVDAILRACRTGAGLREDWAIYHCIGDVLRSGDMGGHSERLAAKFAEQLSREPHLMVTRPLAAARTSVSRTASFAAALAGVAAVALVALPLWNGSADRALQAGAKTDPASVVTAAAPPVAPVTPVAVPQVSREFLAAHRQYSGGLVMQGVVGQVRSVALEPGR